jgi:hypothetical protein
MPVYESATKIANDVCNKGTVRFKEILEESETEATMSFSELTRPHSRQPVWIKLNANLGHGNVIFTKNDEHGFENHSLLVLFHQDDGKAMQKILDKCKEALPDSEDASDWTINPFFKDPNLHSHFLKLAVSKDGKKFKANSNIKLVPHKDSNKLFVGQAVTLEGTIGAWFNRDKKQCGLFLRISQIKFDVVGKLKSVEEDGDEE